MNGFNQTTYDYLKDYVAEAQRQFDANNITWDFPESIKALTKEDLKPLKCKKRRDFRGEDAYTIDCTNTQDMDDAISVIRTSYGYRLAVHIADVSAYVVPGSELNEVAEYRATSVYVPNITIPMLPAVLSNDLCSLNPGVDRNTLSVIMKINQKGDVTSYEITKGVIRSRVKGCYEEINAIYCNAASEDVMNKYRKVLKQLKDMKSLFKILRKKRKAMGARIEDDNRPIVNVTNRTVTLIPKTDGVAENMIEEFMIAANKCVADFMEKNHLPGIYRVQGSKNTQASYQTVNIGHADVAAKFYCHYSSPIRRISDLICHQVISLYLEGVDADTIHSKFDLPFEEICERATKRSRSANQVERCCMRYCYKQYFTIHAEDKYVGKVVDYDGNHHPIILLKKFNIRVLGDCVRGRIGDTFKVNVIADEKNKLYARNAVAI